MYDTHMCAYTEKQKAVRLKECVSMHENQNKELCNQLKTLQQTLSQERAAFEAKVHRFVCMHVVFECGVCA